MGGGSEALRFLKFKILFTKIGIPANDYNVIYNDTPAAVVCRWSLGPGWVRYKYPDNF